MKLNVTSRTPRSIKIVLEDEDVSSADIIHRELLMDEDVVFAAATVPHPLLKKVIVNLETKQKDPKKALIASADRAIKKIEEMLEKARRAIDVSKPTSASK